MNEICSADEAKAMLEAAPPGTLQPMYGWDGPRLIWSASPRAQMSPDLVGFPMTVIQGAARWRDLATSVVHHVERAKWAEEILGAYAEGSLHYEGCAHNGFTTLCGVVDDPTVGRRG